MQKFDEAEFCQGYALTLRIFPCGRCALAFFIRSRCVPYLSRQRKVFCGSHPLGFAKKALRKGGAR